MPSYHFQVKAISRGKGRSVTKLANYICGCKLHDCYKDKTYYSRRQDVLFCKIFQPPYAPPEFHNLQSLCNEIERAEVRYDARTAREFVGSLPNELPLRELEQIVENFIEQNFIVYGLCAIAAIHEGRNETDPTRNNPHVHIIVPTRSVGSNGFSKTKNREWDKRKYVNIWRQQWAELQNQAYERNNLDIRVSHMSLEVQGKYDHEPTIHLSLVDWQKEKRGERTPAGDRKRDIQNRNDERFRQRRLQQERTIERFR